MNDAVDAVAVRGPADFNQRTVRLAPGGASAPEGKEGRLTYSRGRRFSVEDAYGAALNDKCDQPLEQHEESISETDQEVNVHPRPQEPGH